MHEEEEVEGELTGILVPWEDCLGRIETLD
jgi:hypothetical protein